MRCTLVQCAWSLRRIRRDDPMSLWSGEVEKRRGKRVAVTALARKLAGVLYAIWRDGKPYDARRGATLMGPGLGKFATLMGPPNRQGHGATRRVA